MHTKLVTCPETAHLEEIRCVADQGGRIVLVTRCTRFDPPEDVTCCWTCAQRLNAAMDRKKTPTGESPPEAPPG